MQSGYCDNDDRKGPTNLHTSNLDVPQAGECSGSMFSSAETAYHNKTRRWPKYLGLLLVVPILLVSALFVLSSVRVVPPISAKVVDAITGKPVPGMSVCLQVEGMNLGDRKSVV